MSERREVRLGDVADVNWGDTKTTKASYVESGFRAFSASGPDGCLPWADYDRVGIVVSAIGAECGKTWLAKGRWSCIKNTIRFFSSDPTIETEFLYWATRDPSIWPRRGSAQPFISQGDARNIRLEVPPIAEQRAIAGVLGALDDKIESNRRAASTCIKLAQLLLSAGNEQIRVGQCAVIEKGLSYKGAGLAEKGSGTPMFNLGNFGTSGWLDRTSTKYYSGEFKERHTVRTGDLIVANTDLTQQRVILGRPALVPPLPGTGIITHHVFAVRCKSPAIRLALWAQLNGSRFRERAEGYATGTTVASMPPDALADFALEVPSDSQVAEAESLIERAWAAESESETLVATRDTLLPELLSGRLRVRDVEDGLEGVV